MNSKLIVFGAVALLLVAFSSDTSADTSRSATRAQCNNACEDVSSPQCANNGITYKNLCRFNCARAGNNRLRIVKAGSCAGTSLREYRGRTTVPTVSPFSRNTGGRGGWDSWFNL